LHEGKDFDSKIDNVVEREEGKIKIYSSKLTNLLLHHLRFSHATYLPIPLERMERVSSSRSLVPFLE
jgi:hypothetical protein